MAAMPSINIFMMMPNDNKAKSESNLTKALRSKKEAHKEAMGKMSQMIRELQVLPHAEHAGGG